MQQSSLHHDVRPPGLIAQRIVGWVPAGFVLLLGTWTLAYWVALAFGRDVATVGALTVVQLVGLVVVRLLVRGRTTRPSLDGAPAARASGADDGETRGGPRAAIGWRTRLLVVVVVGATGALVQLVSRTLALVLLLACALVVLGRRWWLARPQRPDEPVPGRPTSGAARGSDGSDDSEDSDSRGVGWWWLPGVGLAAAVMAVVSTQFSRPDGDDVYFVGFSTYVAQHGLIPLRDTLMSPQVFPAPQAYDPPLHSWETLIGLIARLVGTSAPTMTYSIVLPVMVVVAIVTLAHLIRECGVPWPLLGLWTAVVLLTLDGADQTTFGLLWVTRLWVGKVVLVAVLVPVLIVHGRRWLRHRRGWDLLMLASASVAALGASSSAVFVVPLVLAALMLAALATRRVVGAVLLLVPMVAPIVIGVLTVVLAPPDPGPAQALPAVLDAEDERLGASTGDLLQLFVLSGWHMVVVLLAVMVGVLGLRDRVGRTVVVALLAVFAVAVSPPANALLLHVLPVLKPVMWRMWFLVPLPLLFAALPAGVVLLVTGAIRSSRGLRGTAGLALGTLVAVGAAVGFVQFGPSILAPPEASRSSWGDFKAEPGAEQAYRFVAAQARDGDVVLSPSASAHLIPIATSRWFAVAPRLDYLRGGFYRSLPQVHAVDRLRLQAWVRGQEPVPTAQLGRELDVLTVDLVCTNGESRQRTDQMLALGWRQTAQGLYACFRRPG